MAKIVFVEPNGETTEQTFSCATIEVNVSNATQATNCQITTSTAHNLNVGQHIIFRDIGGMTQLNSTQENYETGTHKRVYSVIDANNFTLDIDSTGFTAYTSGGRCRSTGVKRTSPGELTVEGHTLVEGQRFYLLGVIGATQVNTSYYKVGTVFDNGFTVLDDINETETNWSAIGAYTSGGTGTLYDGKLIEGATNDNPCVVTVTGHGFSNDDYVYINDVSGITELNGKVYKVANKTDDTFELTGIDSTGFGTFSAGQGYVHRTYLRSDIITGNSLIENVSEIRYTKTDAPTDYASGRSFTWVYGSQIVSYTGSTLVGSIAVGSIVCRKGRGGNGDQDGVYYVDGITSSTITLRSAYIGEQGNGVDDTIRKINPVTTMSPSSGIVVNAIAIVISGGWDFDTNLQDGETWIKQAGVITTSANITSRVISGGEINNINTCFGYYNIQFAGSGGNIINCSCIYSHIYNVYVFGGTNSLENVFIGNGLQATTSYYSMYIASHDSTVFDNVRLASRYSVSFNAFGTGSNITLDCDGLSILYPGRGFEIGINNNIKNLYIQNCLSAGIIAGSRYNVILDNCEIDGSSGIGILLGSNASGIEIKNCLIKNCATQGIYCQNSSRIKIVENEFLNNATNVYADVSSGDIHLINNIHNAPTNWGIQRVSIYSGAIFGMNESIDAGSLAKAYNINVSEENILPQYNFQNSWNGFSGRVYSKGSISLDKTILSPDGNYTTRITPTASLLPLNNFGEFIVDSAYINSGEAVTMPFFLRADGVWSGTITPMLKLNGITIVTGTSITSMSNGSWDSESISALDSEITEDGVLELVLYVESNTISFNCVVEGGVFT